jgi:hypothetical protein
MGVYGRASVSRRWPRAHAICERCGGRFNHDQLQWQFQWNGPRLQNLRILVCRSCLDVPQEQLRTIILPPDPVPIENPRPELSTAIYASLREDGGSALREQPVFDASPLSISFEAEESTTLPMYQQ